MNKHNVNLHKNKTKSNHNLRMINKYNYGLKNRTEMCKYMCKYNKSNLCCNVFVSNGMTS